MFTRCRRKFLAAAVSACIPAQGMFFSDEMLTSVCDQFHDAYSKEGYAACKTAKNINMCAEPGFCEGNRNFERCEMPQLPVRDEKPEIFGPWEKLLAEDGINVGLKKMTVKNIIDSIATQKDINLCKACSVKWDIQKCFPGDNYSKMPSEETCRDRKDGCFCAWKSGVSLCDERHVIDGHHRWAALKLLLREDVGFDINTESVVEVYAYAPGNAQNHSDLISRLIAIGDNHTELVTHTKCGKSILERRSKHA